MSIALILTGLMVLGAIIEETIRYTRRRRQETHKACPDCAETVLADARVCKHCGHRLDAAT